MSNNKFQLLEGEDIGNNDKSESTNSFFDEAAINEKYRKGEMRVEKNSLLKN